MAKESDKFGFSTHSLERGLERIMEYEPPYTSKQKNMMAEFILKNITWHPIREIWVLEDYDAELVIVGDSVVTLVIKERSDFKYRPLTQLQKETNKKALKLGRTRNGKNKYK